MDKSEAKQLTLISSQFRYPLSTIPNDDGCFIPDLTGFSKDTVPKDRTSQLKTRLLYNANASFQALALS